MDKMKKILFTTLLCIVFNNNTTILGSELADQLHKKTEESFDQKNELTPFPDTTEYNFLKDVPDSTSSRTPEEEYLSYIALKTSKELSDLWIESTSSNGTKTLTRSKEIIKKINIKKTEIDLSKHLSYKPSYIGSPIVFYATRKPYILALAKSAGIKIDNLSSPTSITEVFKKNTAKLSAMINDETTLNPCLIPLLIEMQIPAKFHTDYTDIIDKSAQEIPYLLEQGLNNKSICSILDGNQEPINILDILHKNNLDFSDDETSKSDTDNETEQFTIE